MELDRGKPVEARVGAIMVVVVAPCRDQDAGMAQAVEEVRVETFVTQPPIEGFDEAVLHGFARRDVMPFDAALLLPAQDRIGRQLRTVVGDHHARTRDCL